MDNDSKIPIKRDNRNHNNARLIAVRILTRVEKEGSYANLLLRTYLLEMKDNRDRHLVTALVNGVLKNKSTLDYALRQHLSKPMSSLPHDIRSVLRTGAFQILFMDKIPVSAAINESVNLAKIFHAKFPSLVNSVLRKTAEVGWNFQWPNKDKEPVRYLSIRYSHPEWLVKRWLGRLGPDETEELLIANNVASPTSIRVNTLKISREGLLENLQAEGIHVVKSNRTPEGLIIEDYGAVEKLDAFIKGYFTVQDESSQLVVHIMEVKPGDHVLDVCSAPGGKTTHLAQLMENQGLIVAMDLYPQKLGMVQELAERLGITIIHTQHGDARFLEGIKEQFQCVLVDAPCSGLGVIRRRSDLRWQKREDEIQKLPAFQLEILLKASEHVLPGGQLVYSTCTTEPEENFDIVKEFRRLQPDFEPVDLSEVIPFEITDPKDAKQLQRGMLQILPHKHGMDGFFFAKFRRKAGL